jgi:hypothetical protein
MTRLTEQEYTSILRRQASPQKAATTLPAPSEHEEQCAVVQWAQLNVSRLPGLDLLYAIPNGGKRDMAVAVALKAEGVKSGVPDLCLPVPRGGWHGLYVEMKKADHSNGPSPAQAAWVERLQVEGYFCVVAYGAGHAINAITQYLEMP